MRLFYLFLLVILIGACTRNSENGNKIDPEEVNDSSSSAAIELKNANKKSSPAAIAFRKSREIDSTTAAKFTKKLKNADTVQIPVSWTFDTAHVFEVLRSGKCAKFRLYACQNDTSGKNELKLIIVGVDANNVDNPAVMYDFADPCPSSCAKQNNVLMHTTENAASFLLFKK